MDHHVTIPMFTPLWWKGIIISLIGIITLVMIGKKLSPENEIKLRYIIAATIVLREIIWHYHLLSINQWQVDTSLPLHLCGISRLVGAYLLLRPHQLIFEYLILLGMAGALQSFVTPELTHGMDTILLIDFYYAHAIIIGIAMYAFFVMKMELTKWSWLYVFILGHIILTMVGFINFLIGGNYIYLCERPLAENPLIQGEWPYYLISFQIGALIHIVLFSIIFQYIQKRRSSTA
jgi:hypothetical integral membrane protein (TIGR02206 family)